MYVQEMNTPALVAMTMRGADGCITPATQLLHGSLHFVAQWQLTSCFIVLEMTGLDIQGGCHRVETIYQKPYTSPNVMDRG